MCAQGLCKDAKPTKHTQTLTLRKARCDSADAKQAHTDVVVTKGERDGAKQGVVRFWKEWCSNPSGSRPNSFGRQHLTFDKGGKFSARRGIVRFWKVNATSQIIHRRKIISDFIIIAHLGKVNGSYRIVTISLALSNRFSGRRTLPGSNGTFNVIFRFSLLTNCVVMDYNYVRSV